MRDRKEKDTVWAEISSCSSRQFQQKLFEANHGRCHYLWFLFKLKHNLAEYSGPSLFLSSRKLIPTAAANLKCNLLCEQNIVNIKFQN